jgi:hypothetical protein
MGAAGLMLAATMTEIADRGPRSAIDMPQNSTRVFRN